MPAATLHLPLHHYHSRFDQVNLSGPALKGLAEEKELY